MVDDALIARAASALASARLLAVSSGAGVSKESGIPTFREAHTGLWAQYDPEQLATPTAFRRDPHLVWAWYMHRRRLIEGAEPNPAHVAIARLQAERPNVMLITQNVDGLHGIAGSRDVIELHGNLRRYRCADSCQGDPTPVDLDGLDYDDETVPHCPHCGGLVRPDVVWYGEPLPAVVLGAAFDLAECCDAMLVVGTSGVVQPAASLPWVARDHRAAIVEVNVKPSGVTPVADYFLKGPAGEVLPRLVEAILSPSLSSE